MRSGVVSSLSNENHVYIRSCKLVLWPIRARALFELFYNSISSIEVMRIKKNINLGIIS